MRILYAHCFYRMPGGEDRHVRDQVNLVSRNHDVQLLSEANVELSGGLATAATMLYSRTKVLRVGAVIDRFAPDVVHIHNMYPALGPAVVMAANRRDIPVVMTVHNYRLRCPNGLMFTEGSICRRCQSGTYVNAAIHRCFPSRQQAAAYAVVLWVHRFVMRFEDRIARFIVPSEFMQKRLNEWGLSGERVNVVRHFVRPNDFADVGTTDGSYGAFLGRLSPEKGIDVLLAGLRRAGDPPFLIIGDGPERRALENLAGTLELTRTVFLGWRSAEEVGRLVAGARYVAVPSLWEETANLAALEGLAAGRPLLVSECGALPELVATGAGLVARTGDAGDIADKIQLLTEDNDVYRRASKAASTFAHRWLEPERHLAAVEAVYAESIGDRIHGR